MDCIQVFYPTGTEARIATAIGWVECLCRLGGGGRCADLDVAARDAIKERLLLRAVATCCADRVEHRAAHYSVRWSLADVLTYPRAITWIYLKLDLVVKSKARNLSRAWQGRCSLRPHKFRLGKLALHSWKSTTSLATQIWT